MMVMVEVAGNGGSGCGSGGSSGKSSSNSSIDGAAAATGGLFVLHYTLSNLFFFFQWPSI
jgi:hypothetical protein